VGARETDYEEIIKDIIRATPYKTEAFIQDNHTTKVFFDNKLKELFSGNVTSLSIRVRVNGFVGSAFTSDVNDWKSCLNNAIKVAKTNHASFNPGLPRFTGDARPRLFSYKALNFTEEDLIDTGFLMLDDLQGFKVQQLDLSKEVNDVYFGNSNDVLLKSKDALLSSSVSITKNNVTAWSATSSRTLPDFLKVSEECKRLCRLSQNPINTHSKKMEVVFDYYAMTDLIESILIPSFFADRVIERNSFLQDKLNKKVFSKSFSLSDNACLDFGVNSRGFDAEGVRSTNTVLVKEGVVKCFLNDWLSNQLFFKNQGIMLPVTGNCESLLKRPCVGSTNLVVSPGTLSNDELLGGSCLLVTQLVGSHTANIVSGDFSLNTENVFLVNNNRLIPVKNVMINGNVFELFNNIVGVGRSVRSDGSVVTPRIRFKNVQVIT